MAHSARVPTTMTAEAFIETDQSVFGDAWRYELVDGQIKANAAPTDNHGLILTNLVAGLKARLRQNLEGCRARQAPPSRLIARSTTTPGSRTLSCAAGVCRA